MKNVPVEAVCALTGLGKRTVYRLTREGRIPAQIVSRQFVMTTAQFAQLDRDGIRPADPKPEPQSMIRTFERKSA